MRKDELELEIAKYVDSFNPKVKPYFVTYSFNRTQIRFVDHSVFGDNINISINLDKAFGYDDYYLINYKGVIAYRIAQVYLEDMTLSNDLIEIRPFELSDLDDLYEIISDREVVLPDAATLAKSKEHAKRILNQLINKRFGYAVHLKENDKLVGTISIVNSEREALAGELGYSVNKKYWRQGIASSAVRLLLDTLFKTLDYELVEAFTFLDNDKSINLLKKFNFKEEGIIRKKTHRSQIGSTDVYSFSITNEEYLNNDILK